MEGAELATMEYRHVGEREVQLGQETRAQGEGGGTSTRVVSWQTRDPPFQIWMIDDRILGIIILFIYIYI
jgi:hypothetical protein